MRNTSESKRAPSCRALHLPHRAKDADGASVGEIPLEGDNVVQLQIAARGHAHPELERGGVLGADDPSDVVVGLQLLHRGRVSTEPGGSLPAF